MDGEKLTIFFKKRIEPFIAVAILVVLVILSVQLMNGNELREEISQTCGWEEEDYRCFCEKSEAMAIKNKIDGIEDFSFDLGEDTDVQVDR